MDKEKKLPKCILFDFDRTLICLYEDNSILAELGSIMREYYSYYISMEFIDSRDGYFIWHDAHREVVRKYENDIARKINDEAEKKVTEFEQQVSNSREMYKSAIRVIPQLTRIGIKLGIVSSNSTNVILNKVRSVRLDGYFSGIYGRKIPFNPEEIKPSSEPICKAVKLLEECSEDVWYVGDDIIDIKAALKGGVKPIGVATGNYSQEELLRCGAKLTFSDLQELYDYLSMIV